MEHIIDPLKALFELSRILKAGGLFFVLLPSLDYYRTDRTDEGLYEDLDLHKQFQWNLLRKTWESMFADAKLSLFDINTSVPFGVLNPDVFFSGRKK